MIVHLVLLKLRRDVSPADATAVFEAIGALRKVIPGIADYAYGPYSSPEGMNKGFTHGFTMTFESAAAREPPGRMNGLKGGSSRSSLSMAASMARAQAGSTFGIAAAARLSLGVASTAPTVKSWC